MANPGGVFSVLAEVEPNWRVLPMRLQQLAKATQVVLTKPGVFFGAKKYIFVISHMRSYSSLLCHILGSHRDIAGHAEMRQTYFSSLDFYRLGYRLCKENDKQLNGRFLLDKVLHDGFQVSDAILNDRRVRLIFLLRNPEHTIQSIINMGRTICSVEWYLDQKKVLAYYKSRLDNVARMARVSTARKVFVDSERIIEDTEHVLGLLSQWLQLESRLKETYSIFKHTGQKGRGDPSQKIREGRIIRCGESREHIALEPDIIRQAKAHYETCRAVLIAHSDCL